MSEMEKSLTKRRCRKMTPVSACSRGKAEFEDVRDGEESHKASLSEDDPVSACSRGKAEFEDVRDGEESHKASLSEDDPSLGVL